MPHCGDTSGGRGPVRAGCFRSMEPEASLSRQRVCDTRPVAGHVQDTGRERRRSYEPFRITSLVSGQDSRNDDQIGEVGEKVFARLLFTTDACVLVDFVVQDQCRSQVTWLSRQKSGQISQSWQLRAHRHFVFAFAHQSDGAEEHLPLCKESPQHIT